MSFSIYLVLSLRSYNDIIRRDKHICCMLCSKGYRPINGKGCANCIFMRTDIVFNADAVRCDSLRCPRVEACVLLKRATPIACCKRASPTICLANLGVGQLSHNCRCPRSRAATAAQLWNISFECVFFCFCLCIFVRAKKGFSFNEFTFA